MSEGNRPPNPDRPQENEQPLAMPLNDEQPLARPVREEQEAEATQAEAEQQELSRQVEGEQEEKSMADEQDNPGIRVPPPLIYLLPLILGLLLDRRWHVPFLPRGVARIIGWRNIIARRCRRFVNKGKRNDCSPLRTTVGDPVSLAASRPSPLGVPAVLNDHIPAMEAWSASTKASGRST